MVIENLIITMTTWKKRIGNIPMVVDSLLKQKYQAEKIVINLSSSEFTKKTDDFPTEVRSFLEKHNDKVELYWIEGTNTKQWKKTIPTLLRYPESWVICVDDDRLYGENFVKFLWDKHLECPDVPITVNKGCKVNGFLQHCGYGTLEKAQFYNNFQGVNIEEFYQYASSDTFFTYMLAKNNFRLRSCMRDDSKGYIEIEPLSRSQGTCSPSIIGDMWQLLSKKYGAVKCDDVRSKVNPDDEKYALVEAMGYGGQIVIKQRKKFNKQKIIRRI